MSDYTRTHHCSEITLEQLNQEVQLAGWVSRRRDHGGLIFVDLRDKFGLTQLVFDPKVNLDTHKQAEYLRSEWVIQVKGKVIKRSEGMSNSRLKTGDIEIEVSSLEIFSKSQTPPFSICDDNIEVNEELCLKYRYLDIRRGPLIKNLHIRHKAMHTTRNYLDNLNFIDIQTPILGRSTPEGARDYLVPSRIHPGNFYALPQSPQIFKQLLMVCGLDRYYQIAPCFRDEDLRADRQPEFYQIDIELSFSDQEILFPIIESLCHRIFKEANQIDLSGAFPRLSYHECIEKYGTDKPDLRFDMKLVDITDLAKESSFSIFLQKIDQGCIVKGLCVKGGADLSRKKIDEYTKFVSYLGIEGLAWMKHTDDGLHSSIVKFFPKDIQQQIIDVMQIETGDLIFLIADTNDRTNKALDHLRRKLAKDRNLIKKDLFKFLWVTEFPLFKWDSDNNSLASEHHPFTQPHLNDLPLLDTEPLSVRSSSYDLVLNGYELASGSQRIHCPKLQQKIFSLLKLPQEEINQRFGFFVKALSYGTPPHLGIAIGVERLVMILAQTENIRDVLAFPKTQKASDLMTEAPSSVDDEQLDILKLS